MSHMHCSGCGETKFLRLESIEALHYSPGRVFALFHCENCGLVHTGMAEERASVLAYYPDNYKPHVPSDTKRISFRSILMRKLRKFTFGKQETASSKFIQQVRRTVSWLHRKTAYRSIPVYRTEGKLLDVGCGIGDYISLLDELGWCVYGVETSRKAADFANQLERNVECVSFEGAKYLNNFFDVITMWHALEHFSDPKQMLEKALQLLKNDGVIILGVPNYNSFDRIIFRKYWNGYEIPLHLYHFTPSSLKNLLVRSGYKVTEITHTIRPTDMVSSFRNFLYSKNICSNTYVGVILYFVAVPLSVLFCILKKSSIIIVYAEKNQNIRV